MLITALLALAADPVPLAFHPSGVFDTIPSSMLMNVTPTSRERPETITVEPEYENEPWYAAAEFGDAGTLIHFALDESDDKAVLYIDANANGDLTDDPAIEGRREVVPEERRSSRSGSTTSSRPHSRSPTTTARRSIWPSPSAPTARCAAT